MCYAHYPAYLKISRVPARDMSVNIKFELSCTVGMLQLNLNLTEYTWGMGSTRHVFHFTHVQGCVCTVHEILKMSNQELIINSWSNLLFRALVYDLDECMIVCTYVHAYEDCTCQNLDSNCKPRIEV